MKKFTFLLLVPFLLLAAALQAQVTVSGYLTSSVDGSPVANHEVKAIAGAGTVLFSTGSGFSDANGYYNFTFNVDPSLTTMIVSTQTNCTPVGLESVTATILNAQVAVDFEICQTPPPPTCSLNILATPTATSPYVFQFEAELISLDNSAPVLYLWNFGDGTTSTEASPIHTFATGGLYVVTATVTNIAGCTGTTTFLLDVTIPPPPACVALITYAESATGFVFTANSNPGLPPLSGTFVWDFGDGSPTVTTTDPTVTHAFTTTGAFTVTLTAYANGCVATTTVVVLAFNNPVGEFAYGCQALFHTDLAGANPADPLTVAFVDASLGAANKWTWDFGDGQTSTTQNPTHTFAAEGDYVVQLSTESISGCESNTHFVVHAGATPPFVQELDCQALFVPLPGTTDGTSLLCVDLSKAPQGIQTWNWDFGDGQTSTEQYPHHTYAAAGAYDVSLQITGPGCNSVLKMEIESESPWGFNAGYLSVAGAVSGTSNVAAFDAVRVFPNPVSSTLTAVFAAKSAESYELRVSDLTGRLWSSARQQAAVGANTVQADLTTCPAGVYFVELRTAQSLQVFRVVKQ